MHEIQAILPTHVIVNFTKFYKDGSKNIDFSILAYFGASVIYFVTVSSNKEVSEQKMKNSLSFLQDSSYKKEIIDFSYTINEPFNNVGIRVVL